MTLARQGPRLVLAALAVLFAAGFLHGCGDDDPPRTVEVVVPAGTQERLDAGEPVVVMPARIDLQVGDTLRIRNDDEVDQTVGPYFVSAGGEIELTYSVPGRYEGYCPLSEGERYEIVVEG